MGFVGANKRFLWAGVGTPGSAHDSTLLPSSPIFTDIESGQVLPSNYVYLDIMKFPLELWETVPFLHALGFLKHIQIPQKTRGILQQEIKSSKSCFGTCLWHVEGQMETDIQENRKSQEKNQAVMACIALHNLCIARSDPCLPCINSD